MRRRKVKFFIVIVIICLMWLVSIPVMDSFLSASISIKNASQDLKTEQRGDEEQEISIMAILRMADGAVSEPPPGFEELKEWLQSSLCGCAAVKKTELPAADKEQDTTESTTPGSMDTTVLDKFWTDGRIFQWLIHSFKPEQIPCPSSEIGTVEADFSKLQLTFKVAQEELGVQDLLLPGDFASAKDPDKKPDTLALLTYLAQLKYALRNAEPACPTPRPQAAFTWPYVGEAETVYLRSVMASPKCHNCQETVLVLDRFLLSNALSSTNDVRHRRCFRCERCHKLLRIGLYRPTRSGLGYECLEHEKEDLVARATPASDQKTKQSETKEEGGASERKAQMYPELPKADRNPLYPRLASPEETTLNASADSGVATSSPDLTVQGSSATSNQLSPPTPSRSRSSERDIPVPAPRKSLHSRGGSDVSGGPVTVSTENVSTPSPSAVSPAGKPSRPERPVLPPKPKAGAPPVQLRHDYPEELNPFGDDPPAPNRHSTPPVSAVEKPKPDQRFSMAVSSKTSTSGSKMDQSVHSDNSKSLNPFGSDTESDEDEKAGDNDDASSLSSTNPFNESDAESDNKGTPFDEETKAGGAKKLPPPRPPPPSKTVPVPASSTPKQKKRPAPAPPPSTSQATTTTPGGGPPPRPASPKKQHRKKRPAPPRPLPLKRQIRTESALSPEQLASAFEENEKQLVEVETAGGTFEKDLRRKADEKGLAKFTHSDVQQWIDFVYRKFDLIRKETELVYMCRERQLDELHAEIEYQLRCIIEKPESEKTSEDMDREASLLQRMLDVIEEKSKLVDNQDEMRAQTGALPRNSIALDDSSLSAGTASKSSTLDKRGRSGKSPGEKQEKKKKKIKLRLKKLKQKIANSTLLHHS